MCIRDRRKSFEKAPHDFDHFLIFWCKFARRFLKRLGFGPPVSFQRKSSKNFTPFLSHFTKEKKTRVIARWRCLSKLHSKISLKRGRKGKKVKGFDLIDLRLATTWYHSILSTGHKGTYQTYCLKLTLNSTSPLVGCGEVCFGRVHTKVPPPNNQNLGLARRPKRGEARAGWVSGDLCDPLYACATRTACVTYRACSIGPGLSEKASLGIFWPQKCTFCLTDPLFGSSLAAQKFRIAFNLLRKTLKLTLGRGRTWSVKLYVIFKYTL